MPLKKKLILVLKGKKSERNQLLAPLRGEKIRGREFPSLAALGERWD